jgi:polar amino acid transport system substrate-binding protein
MAAELAEIIDRGYLIVGVKDQTYPLGYRDETGTLQGLEIDIARQLALDILGNDHAIEFVPVLNSERLQVILNDQVDLTIAQLTRTPSRARLVQFSPPYYFDGMGLITLDPALTADQLNAPDQTIAVLHNSTAIAISRNTFPQARWIGVDSYQQAQTTLQSQTAIAFLGDKIILAGWAQQYPKYHLLDARLSVAPLAIAMPKGLQYLDLHTKVIESIQSWENNGWLADRINHWQLPNSDF